MKKRFVALMATPLFCATAAFCCSTGYLKDSPEKVFVKSYDWRIGSGNVTVNKRNVRKNSFLMLPTDKTKTWVSQYGSVTFNQHGREFPLGGMNEAGLTVEIMWLDSSIYPPADERPTVNELQWIQYQLDNYKSVPEVLEHLDEVRISRIYAPVHYLVCDRHDDCLSVENIQGALVTHTADQMPAQALTNDSYSDSVRYLSQFIGFGGSEEPKPGLASLDRFTRMALAIRNYSSTQETLGYAFSMLDSVKAPHTKFQIVYELANQKIHFRTADAPEVKSVDAQTFDFNCTAPVVIHNMNSATAGDVSGSFEAYTSAKNLASLQEGMVGIAEFLPPGTVERWASYPETTDCLSR